MNNWSIYKHTTPNGKVYVGLTSQNPIIRWNSGHGYDHQLFGKAVRKYGWSSIKHEVVASGLSKQQAIDMEVELILRCRSMEPAFGYNVMPGGECGGSVLGRRMSEETKAKMSLGARARWQDPERGGHRQSPEWIDKRRQAWIGRRETLEHKEKLRKANSKPVICIETGIEYESGGHAARALGGSHSNLSNHLNGTKGYNTFKGYTFSFAPSK